LTPNPSLRVDPALNIVVLEFRSANGDVVRSMPTERELANYRAAIRRGDQPEGRPAPQDAEAPPARPSAAPERPIPERPAAEA